MESSSQEGRSLQPRDSLWASRKQATAHQLRRLSSQASPEDAVENGIVCSLAVKGSQPARPDADAPRIPQASSSMTEMGPPLSQSRSAAAASDEAKPSFVSTMNPSLQTLCDGVAALEREYVSVCLSDRTLNSSASRHLAAPVARQPAAVYSPADGVAAAELVHMQQRCLASKAHEDAVAGEGSQQEAPRPLPPLSSSPSSSLASPPTSAKPVDRGAALLTVKPLDREPFAHPPPKTGSLSIPSQTSAREPSVAAPSVELEEATVAPQSGRAVGTALRPHRSGHLAPVAESVANSSRFPGDSPLKRPLRAPSAVSRTEALHPPQPQGDVSSLSPSGAAGGKSRDGRIKVVVRKRPFNAGEEGVNCVDVNGPHVVLSATKQRVDLSEYIESSDYAFDDAFGETVTNEEVYASCVPELLDVALQGGSASVFAYGQTGSGKTYTMMGDADADTDADAAGGDGTNTRGLYLLGAAQLFSRLSPSQSLTVSFYEIYCNSLFDLLNNRAPVVLREDSSRKVNVCGLSWHSIGSAEELWMRVRAGLEQRRTGSTSANERSSRSHAVMSIRIKDALSTEFEGTLNFVDLAGSERGADTANNDRLTRLEGAEINKSLLALKECIRSLDEKKRHVPFRGSRLTEVLRDSFMGNSKTVMIANVSPSSANYDHTANTLRYAFRVKGLSIASVVPSKARNAPRPFQLGVGVARSRIGLWASPPNSRPLAADDEGGAGAGEETHRGGARGGRPTPPRQPSHRHRSNSSHRRGRFRHGSKGRPRSPSPATSDADKAPWLWHEDEVPGQDRGVRLLRVPSQDNPLVPRRHLALCNDDLSQEDRGSGNSRQGNEESREHSEVSAISLLLGDSSALPLSSTSSPLPLPRIGRSGSSHTAANIGDPSPLPSFPSRGLPTRGLRSQRRDERAREEEAEEAGEGGGVFLTKAELSEMETRVKMRVMRQLQLDLGKEIHQVLDERDGLIADLRAENAALREAVGRMEKRAAATAAAAASVPPPPQAADMSTRNP